MAHSISNTGNRPAFSRRFRAILCIGSAGIALNLFAAGDRAWADDITISTDTSTGVNLDGQAGSTVGVLSGVNVTNVDFSRAVNATLGPWTLTNRGNISSKFANSIQLDVTNSAVINFGSIAAGSSSNAISLTGGGSVENKLGASITSNQSAIIIGKSTAGVGSVINAGTITQTGTSGDLVTLLFGGTVTNLAGATITANNSSNAVSVGQGASRTVINSGTIINTGTSFATGVLVQGGPSTVTNNAGGIIRGTFNGLFASATGVLTFTNAGLIESTGNGVNSRGVEGTGGGTFVNSGTIQSANSDGLFLGRAGTVTNSGTIKGAVNAINFSGNFARTLNLDTGSVLTGLVQGGTGVDDLVLLGTGSQDISKILAFETFSHQGTAWTLNGAGTFTASAAVQSGALTVNGTLTSPTMTVASGATLKGAGAIAGATSIANGGTLVGSSGQLFTMSSLALNGTSNINIALGLPSATALFSVGNALTLDGLLNVTNAGGFALGTYRLINYGGALTNNGLTIQSLPNGFNPGDWSIDTATSGQVNLSVASGAGEQYWDGPSMTPGNIANGRGGTGTWNTANTNWTNQAGTINAPWASQNAVFAAAGASTVTVVGPQTFTGLRFLGGADYSLVAGAAGGLVTTGSMAPIIVEQTGAQTSVARIATPVSGTGGITKGGAGLLALSGANSYAGGTSVDAGTLQISADANLGAAAGGVTINGASLLTDASFASTRTITLGGGGTLSQAGGTTLTDNGVIGGGGGLTKAGAGTLILTGANNYSGGTTIAAGALQIGDGGTTGSILGDVVDNGSLIANRSDDISFGGIVSGSGTLTKSGAGTLILSGASSYAGGTTINAGILRISADNNLGAAAGGVAINGATLQTDATFAMARTITLTGGGTLNQATGTILTDSGVIGGSGGLTKAGTGTLILTGANTYAGNTTITAGTLQIGSGGAAGSITGNVSVANGATFTFNRSDAVNFAGGISGAGALTKLGAGTLTLSGSSSTFTGTGTVSAGALDLSGTLGGNLTVASGARLQGSGTAGAVTIQNGGTLQGAGGQTLTMGSLSLGATSIVSVSLGAPSTSRLFNVTGALTLDGTLNVTGTGAFGNGIYRLFDYGGTLTNNVLAIGTVPSGFSAGNLAVQTAIANQVNLLVQAGPLTTQFFNGATTTPTGRIEGGSGVWKALSPTNWTDQTGTRADAWSGNFSIFQGSRTGVGAPASGTVTVDTSAGAISTTGMQFIGTGWTVTGGPVVLAGAGGSTSIRVGDGSAAGAGDNATINSVLSGATRLVKDDLGTLTLSGANIYSGGTTINAGTLRVSADANLGAVAGAVGINGATLQTDASFATARAMTLTGGGTLNQASGTTLTASGTIGGAGGLTKTGTGTLILSSANTYAGGTTVNAGTLRVSADNNLGAAEGGVALNGTTLQTDDSFATTRNITLTGGGTLSQANSTTLSAGGVIGGSGGLIKAGGGALTLTGANTYTGGTKISSGALQIGGGGTTGSIVGDVIDNGTLLFSRSDDLGFAGVVSGSGNLIKAGVGTLTLTGTNSYAGNTQISAGTLSVGSGGTTGSITGNVSVAGGATFVLNRSDTVTFAGTISGAGASVKQGAGTLSLSGNSVNYRGAATLQTGTLDLGGTLGGSLAVASGTRLQGIGTGGAVSILSGGTVAPGNSIGTLNVGSISFAAGSIYEVEANAAGQADRITATGAATINGGTVKVLAQNDTYGLSTTYTILNAGGGVSGTGFSGVTSNLAFLTPSLQQTANSVLLTLKRNTIDFAAVGGTPTQVAVGRAVQSLGTGALYNAVLALDAPGARAAFDAVSGEIHPSLRTALFEDSRMPREAVLRRLGAPDEHRGIWGEAFGDWGASYADGNAAKMHRESTGLVMGVDTLAGETWRFGIAGGYTHHSLSVPARASTAKVNMIHALAYAGATYGQVRIALGAGYAHVDARTDRAAAFTSFTDRLKADYNGTILQGFAELGYRMPLGGGAVEPFARLAVVHVKTDAFAESGGAAALAGAGNGNGRATSTLGFNLATPIVGHLYADAKVGWRHAFGDQTPLSTLRFASGGGNFTIAGAPYSRDAAVAEGGLNLQASAGLTLWVRYSGVLGDQGDNQAVRGGIRLTF